MRINRHFIHFLALLALPFVVVWCNPGFWSTTFLLLLWLLSRWFLIIQRFRASGGPDLFLETVPVSHLVLLYSLLKAMIRAILKINDQTIVKCNKHIDTLLHELNKRLATSNYLIGDQCSFADYTFASLSGLWVQPVEFGNQKADGVRVDLSDYPQSMATSIAQWSKLYPHAVSFVNTLYRTERPTVDQAPASSSVE